MIKLRDRGDETDGSRASEEVTKNLTEADIKQQELMDAYNARQRIESQPQTGLLGKMFVDPNAARELPQTEGARILAMGKSGIALLGGEAPEFPFAAWAQQHLPNVQPSVNSKMMEQTLGKYINEGKADPRIEDSLHKMVSQDLLPDAYALGQKYPHEFTDILNGYVKNPEQERDYLKFKEKADAIQTLRDNSLLLPEFLKKTQESNDQKGLVMSPELQKSISDYYDYMNGTIGKGNMEEDAIKEQQKLLNNLHGYAALDDMVKKVLPEKGSILKGTEVAPAFYTDPKTGKQVPIANAFAENNYENPNTQALKDDLAKRADLILSGADDDEKSAIAKQLGSKKDDDSLRKGLMNYMYSILPKGGTTTLHREAPINISVNTGSVQTGTVYQAAGEKQTFGEGSSSFQQEANASYGLTPFKADIGKQNVINPQKNKSEEVDLTGVEIGNIQNRRVKVVNGELKFTDEKGSDTFVAPFAVATKTIDETKYKRDQDGNIITDPVTKQPIKEGETKTGTEQYFLPVSNIANIKTTDDNTVTYDRAYQEAMEANKTDANKEANEQFEQRFGMTKIDIYKQKKTGTKSTKSSTTNPAYNY